MLIHNMPLFIVGITGLSVSIISIIMMNRIKSVRKHAFREAGLWRGWLTINDPDYMHKGVNFHLEVSYGRTWRNLGFKLHFGDRGSETPFHFNLYLWWISFYFSMNTTNMGRIFEWIGRGHKRDISLTVHNGQLWWKLWFDDDMGYDRHHECDKWRMPWWWPFRNRKYRSWMCLRDGNIDLNPLNVWWGHPKFSYETIDELEEDVFGVYQFEGDVYDVTFKLEKGTQQREHGPRFARRPKHAGYYAHWECKEGIPFRNHEWKGDCSYGSAVKIDGPVDTREWVGEAHRKLQEDIIEDRERCGYNPPRTQQDELVEQKLAEQATDVVERVLGGKVVGVQSSYPEPETMPEWERELRDIKLDSISLDPGPNAFGEVVHIVSEDTTEIETGFIDKIDGEEVTLEQINKNREKDGLPPLPKED